jgi:HD-like signal output (HDOD) protein
MSKKRILFVDDDDKVLKGLQRMLRKYRREWDMTFVQSGAEALKVMESKSFDVIITDMRMPEMDGNELLRRVKAQSPQTVRIILSGHAGKEMIMKTVHLTHQYLSKPCDPKMLKNSVSRTCAIRELLAQDSLLHVISQAESLPSPPSIYTMVTEALQQPDCSARQLGEIIAEDIGMAAKILQLVNSAFFGIPRRFADVSEAVVFLGTDTIQSLVLTFGIFSQFSSKKIAGLDIENLSKHGLQAAAIARSIAKAETKEREVIDNTFMAGLLHDLGKLILAANLPESYLELEDRMQQEKMTPHEAEMAVFGTTHAEVGAYLLGIWGLNDLIIEAIAWHHHPKKSPVDSFTPLAAVHTADVLAHQTSGSGALNHSASAFDVEFLTRIGRHRRISVWQNLAIEESRRAQTDE